MATVLWGMGRIHILPIINEDGAVYGTVTFPAGCPFTNTV